MPPSALWQVLTFHLLRYFFDAKTGTKKKNSSPIQFPESLVLTDYIESSDDASVDEIIYDLQAVCIHQVCRLRWRLTIDVSKAVSFDAPRRLTKQILLCPLGFISNIRTLSCRYQGRCDGMLARI